MLKKIRFLPKTTSILKNEEGSVIFAALMILVLLTIIGIASTNISNTEVRIAGHEVVYQQNFYRAEGASVEAVELLEAILDPKATPPSWLETALDDGNCRRSTHTGQFVAGFSDTRTLHPGRYGFYRRFGRNCFRIFSGYGKCQSAWLHCLWTLCTAEKRRNCNTTRIFKSFLNRSVAMNNIQFDQKIKGSQRRPLQSVRSGCVGRVFIALMAIIFVMGFVSAAQAGFTYRKPVTVHNSQVSGGDRLSRFSGGSHH